MRTFWMFTMCALFAVMEIASAHTVTVQAVSPITAGNDTGLIFSSDVNWADLTTCEQFDVRFSGQADWGDGTVSFFPLADAGCGSCHAYKAPGRYRVRVIASWRIVADPYGPDCDQPHGPASGEAWVEVTPNSALMTNGWIGTFFDREATMCAQPSLPGDAARVYVVAGAPATGPGIAGAEFRLRAPEGYLVSASPLPGWIAIGDAFQNGVTIASACSPDNSHLVAMLEVAAFPLAGTTDGHVLVEGHRTPSNPMPPGPVLVKCDPPIYSAVTAGHGFSALLNPSDGMTWPCPQTSPVFVVNRAWSGVKGLYR